MLKKLSAIMMALTLVFSVAGPGLADAASYKAPKKSFSPNTGTQAPANNATKTPDANTSTKTPGTTTTAPAAKPGFFSGGLMKGLLIGGLAGMLFGGLFGNMGFLGEMLGLLVNVAAIFLLFVLVMKIVSHFRTRKKYDQDPRHNH